MEQRRSSATKGPAMIAVPDTGEINDENGGDFTMTFENGHVSYAQKNSAAKSGASGTVTVNGNAVTMAFDQGSNAGETFAFHWSVYKNTLTFWRDEKLGIGPTPWLVKTWTKS